MGASGSARRRSAPRGNRRQLVPRQLLGGSALPPPRFPGPPHPGLSRLASALAARPRSHRACLRRRNRRADIAERGSDVRIRACAGGRGRTRIWRGGGSCKTRAAQRTPGRCRAWAVLIGGAGARLANPGGDAADPALLAYQAVLVAVAVGLYARLRDPAASMVADLVVELGETRSGTLRDRLARALGDPTLAVGYWSPEARGHFDHAGRELVLPGASPAVPPPTSSVRGCRSPCSCTTRLSSATPRSSRPLRRPRGCPPRTWRCRPRCGRRQES